MPTDVTVGGTRFPKREACLMAMSYSYELQAKVFDKMTALEALVARPVSMSRMDILKLAMESEQRAIDAELSREQAIASFKDLMATLKLAGDVIDSSRKEPFTNLLRLA